MLKFLGFAVKVQLNVHDLNNEAVAGNVTDIRLMEFIDEAGEKREAPAVSGRMLKHWHYEAMRNLINNGSYTLPLCDACKVGEPIRPARLKDSKLNQISPSEDEALTSCCICDVHGYLIAQAREGAGVSVRRSSRAMFSWLMPVLEAGQGQKQVVHTRVSQQEEVAKGEGAAQMIFNKSYASGIYAFVSALDISRIGLIELNLGSKNPYAIDDTSRAERIKVSIEAYRELISGKMGASLSHAIPHGNPLEILIAYSEEGSLPFPVSPIYSDYIEKTKGIMPEHATLLYWAKEKVEDGLTFKTTIKEIFEELLSKV